MARTHVTTMSPWPRKLAVAVLEQALVDLRSHSPEHRMNAAQFFADLPALDFWATQAGLSGAAIRDRVGGRR
jgi:hypothetical protein